MELELRPATPRPPTLSRARRFATDRINSRVRLAPNRLEAREATSR